MKKKTYPIRFVLMIILYQCSSVVGPADILQEDQFSLPEEVQYSLERHAVIPVKYEVIIEHHVDAPTPYFKGKVRIQVHCTASTNAIHLHKAGGIDIQVKVVKLSSNADDNQFKIIGESHFDGNDWLLVLDKQLEKNKNYEVYIEFYSDFYATEGYIFKSFGKYSNQKVMTFTKLNEFDARKVIPCLDQINVKAKFKMWFLHPKRLTSFSNAAIKSTVDIDTSDEQNWVKVEFHETKNMATFSIAMALTQFKTTGLHTPSEVNVQTWAEENVILRMLYINQIASESFKFFSKLFDVPHPMEKLDILILPDVKFEIEESFGIIFMSQKYVLDTLDNSSILTKYEMVLKICHAVSYQWIGSTVTMSKWKDTWFHQGLNYFLQKECAKEVFPEYPQDILHLNTIESFLGFMRSEEMEIYGEPIKILKSYPESMLMKSLTIEKVYHLIRMVQFIMGPKLFEESLAKYMKDFRCRNSDVDQALDVFTQKAKSADPPIITSYGFEIKNIMISWLHQTGAPLILADRNDETNQISIHQTFFKELVLSKQHEGDSNERYWLIPLPCTTEKDSKFDEVTPRVWLQQYPKQWSPPGEFFQNDWFLFNLEFNVPGRVLYDDKTWILIYKYFIDENTFKKINLLTRARLVSDMFTMAEAGVVTYEIVLRMMEYLQYEEEYIPWMIALKEFDRIRSRLLGRDLALFEKYQEFVRVILKSGFQKLIVGNDLQNPTGYSVENEFQMLFREISCKFDFEECSKESSEMNYIRNRISNLPLEFELQHRFYKDELCEKVKSGNEKIWNTLWEQYYEEPRQSSKEAILQAFGCLKKKKDLQRLLEESITYHRQISREDSVIIFQSLVSNKNGYLLMKDFFKKFYEEITSFHSEGEPSTSILSYLRILLDATNKKEHYEEILQFANSKKIDTSDDKLTNISMDNANRNIMWSQRNKKDLQRSLSNIKLKKSIDTMMIRLKFK